MKYGSEGGDKDRDATKVGELAIGGNTKKVVGSSRMLFGTDHPFFPPLKETDKWKSVMENLEAIESVEGWGEVEKDNVRGGNAVRIFGLGS